MKPEDKAVVQQVRKYLVPGAIVPVDVPTTQLLLRVLRQLLEQPAPVQEPVGEVSGHDWSTGLLYRDLEPGTPLYTTPPAQPTGDNLTPLEAQSADHADELTIAYLDGVHTGKRLVKREWVGLTDEEISEIEDEYIVDYRIPAGCSWNFAKHIETELRKKNGGDA